LQIMTMTHSHLSPCRAPTAGRLYRRLVEAILILIPMWLLLYMGRFPPNQVRFESSSGHALLVLLALAIGTATAFICWRGYRVSREASLRWLSLGFLAATLSCAAHGLVPLLAGYQSALFEAFSAICRFELAAGLLAAILAFGRPAEQPDQIDTASFWRRWTMLLVLGNLLVVGLDSVPGHLNQDIPVVLNVAIVIIALSAIVAMLRQPIDTPVMNAQLAGLALFGQASVAFLFSRPWDDAWWLGHAVFGAGYAVLSYGMMRGYLATRSITARQRRQDGGVPGTAAGDAGPADAPPGTVGRHQFMARAGAELARSLVTHSPLSIVGLSIHRWPSLRRHHGEDDLERIRSRFVANAAELLRPLDVLGATDDEDRYFVLLPDTDMAGACRVAKRIRQAGEDQAIPVGSFALRIGCCAGVAQFGPDGRSPEEVLQVAQARLALAVESGRATIISPEAS
jgi:GGDEF domain-containing protein